jgi:hypothetical protein
MTDFGTLWHSAKRLSKNYRPVFRMCFSGSVLNMVIGTDCANKKGCQQNGRLDGQTSQAPFLFDSFWVSSHFHLVPVFMGSFIIRVVRIIMGMGMLMHVIPMPMRMRMNDELSGAIAARAYFRLYSADTFAFRAILGFLCYLGHDNHLHAYGNASIYGYKAFCAFNRKNNHPYR